MRSRRDAPAVHVNLSRSSWLSFVRVCAASALLAAPAGADEPPRVQEVEVTGATAFSRERILGIVRVRPGEPLRRDAAQVAASLQQRYQDEGYLAASVAGAFEDGRLRLAVDEGRLAAVELEGLAGSAAERARAELALPLGEPLRRHGVEDGLDRLRTASGEAIRPEGDPPYRFERSPDGVRLTLTLRRSATRVSAFPATLGEAGLYNRADGLSPGVGAELVLHDFRRYDHAHLYARGAYGLAPDSARFAIGLWRPIGRAALGYEWHDLTASDDAFRAGSLEAALGTALFRSSFRDYYWRRGHFAWLGFSLRPGLRLGLEWRGDDERSLPLAEDWSLLRRDATPRPNPAIAEGQLQSLAARLAWRSQGSVSREAAELWGGPWPGRGMALDASLELGRGDFHFTRGLGQLRAARESGPVLLRGRLLLGAGEDLPPQRQLALGGLGTLRGRHFKEFSGERLVLATAEVVRRTRPRLPSLVAFYDGGRAWHSSGAGPLQPGAGPLQPGAGWRNDLGLGLELSAAGRVVLRVDLGVPLDPEPGRDRARLSARLSAPF